MTKHLVLIIFSISFMSCSQDYRKEYHPDGKLKNIVFYQGKNKDSIISYNRKEELETIKKIYNEDSLYVWEYDDGRLLKDGMFYRENAIGKWNFYNDDYISIIREYVLLDGKSYFNQEWHFDKNGDTIKDKGNYFKINSKKVFSINNDETIRFFFEKPISNFYKNEMILVYDAEFHNKKTKEVQKDSGEILGVNNEVVYEVSFEDEGEFIMNGYILERYKFINDSTSEKLSRTRKLYFDMKVAVIDSIDSIPN